MVSFIRWMGLFACMHLGSQSLFGQSTVSDRLHSDDPDLHVYIKTLFNYRNCRLDSIFNDIERKTGYSFYDNRKYIDKRISFHQDKDMNLEQLMDSVLSTVPLNFKIKKHQKAIIIIDAPPLRVNGIVTNEQGEPLGCVQVAVKEGKAIGTTDSNGRFSFPNLRKSNVLVFTASNDDHLEVLLKDSAYLKIRVPVKAQDLDPVIVESKSGYEDHKSKLNPGSSPHLTDSMVQRSHDQYMLDHIQGLFSGVLFDRGARNPLGISIRGIGTFFSNRSLLIVVDNFIYAGDPRNINPLDIENVTVLKDAVAASVWGAHAANGVIVITTRKGNYKSAPRWSFTSGIIISRKPDLFSHPQLDPRSYAGYESTMFSKGYYDNLLSDPAYLATTPVVEVLSDLRNGKIASLTAGALIDSISRHDTRRDLLKYVYRALISQQYHVSFTGAADTTRRYYFSAGFSRDLLARQGENHERFTLDGIHTWHYDKLDLSVALNAAGNLDQDKDPGMPLAPYPYAALVDAEGRPATVDLLYRKNYTDTAGGGYKSDWGYRPLDELGLTRNRNLSYDLRLQLALKYRFTKAFSVELTSQYVKGGLKKNNLHDARSYFTRNLVNLFSRVNGQNIIYPIPQGGIQLRSDSGYSTYNYRLQANYERASKDSCHRWNFFIGGEVLDSRASWYSHFVYGVDKGHKDGIPVDQQTLFPTYITGEPQQIPSGQPSQTFLDFFLSSFSSLSYIYKDKYCVYLSARKDATNIVGVETNKKWAPFGSMGATWEISKEPFYRSSLLSLLRLKTSWGLNGNAGGGNALLVIQSLGNNAYGSPQTGVANPANPNLSWEKSAIWNIGLDLASKKKNFTASLEYFRKRATDLIGVMSLSPSTGVSFPMGNSAGIRSEGVELALNIMHDQKGRKDLKWDVNFIFNYVTDHVTEYQVLPENALGYVQGTQPVVGRSVSGLFSYRWAGLDNSGDPLGYLAGRPGKEYSSILNATTLDGIRYRGPAQPPLFGSVRPGLHWKKFSFSALIIFKAGYFLRRSSVNYNAMLYAADPGNQDYDRRWKTPGDEKFTSIPGLPALNDPTRDLFYQYSDALVIRGDHIRLRDVQLAYDISPSDSSSHLIRRIKHIRISASVTNPGILWRANKFHIDPDASDVLSYPARANFGLNLHLDF